MDTREGAVADRVVLSYRAPGATGGEWELADSEWIRDRMRKPSYTKYLKRAHAGPVAVGEEWAEFVNCGCASPQDVVLRVEAVEGGEALGMETAIDVRPRRDVVEGAPA
jgi:hypothetical protein